MEKCQLFGQGIDGFLSCIILNRLFMGDFRVRPIRNKADRRQAYLSQFDDLRAFEIMIEEGLFDAGPAHIGAEQELCLVGPDFQPTPQALAILDELNEPHYTNELALYNLEVNLDPYPLKGDCFRQTEVSLLQLLKKGQKAAAKHQAHILQCGIMPSLKYRNLQFKYMTPEPRYKTLSEELKKLRGAKFEIYLQGVDDLIMSLDSVLFEACNTSFQLHLQIAAQNFVEQHNWSQMIAGPVLSACVNSPLLFGRELWAESRIALFKQSLDTRSSSKYLRDKQPRVYFGQDWLWDSPAEIWRNNLSRFPLLLTSDDFETATKQLAKGEIPELRAIRLQNGTTYTWNRLCYGPTSPQAHLRIECRYIPAGPSTIDEMANFAFWVGLMESTTEWKQDLHRKVNFKTAKENFIKAARTGLGSTFSWMGQLRPAKALLLEDLLPLARQGLAAKQIAAEDIDRYLGVFEQRVAAESTPAGWTVRNFRNLKSTFGTTAAETELTRLMLQYQAENLPIHQWPDYQQSFSLNFLEEQSVEYLMSRDLYAVKADDCLEKARQLMAWNAIHHLPVEGPQGELVGLLTDGILKRAEATAVNVNFVEEVMIREVHTIAPQDSIRSLRIKMAKEELSGLPVVYQGKLVGMVTNRDLERLVAAEAGPKTEMVP